jgi:hypothetical protein
MGTRAFCDVACIHTDLYQIKLRYNAIIGFKHFNHTSRKLHHNQCIAPNPENV